MPQFLRLGVLLLAVAMAAYAQLAPPAGDLYLATGTLPYSSSAKCLNIPNNNQRSGQALDQRTCNFTLAQRFRATSAGNGWYKLRSTNGLCLSIASASTRNGASVIVATCSTSADQYFSFQSVSKRSDDSVSRFAIRPRHANFATKCLEIAGSSTNNGARVQLWDCNTSNAQKFAWASPPVTSGSGTGGITPTTNTTNTTGTTNPLPDSDPEILRLHNEVRDRHATPRMIWSSTLQASAQAVANLQASTCVWEHSGTPGVGENLYVHSAKGSWLGAKLGWYDKEIGLYNFNQPGWTPGAGHFTQMVWVASTQLGCAVAFSSRCNWGSYYVCHYAPPGNVIGTENFRRNVLPLK